VLEQFQKLFENTRILSDTILNLTESGLGHANLGAPAAE